MNGCEHFTIRDFVSEVRERDWKLTFPLRPLPPDMTPEQIKALLPPMESSQFKRWNCARCVADEFFQGCGLSSDDEHVTSRKDNLFMADKIISVPADDNNTTDSDLLNTEKPKALLLFDLNETPEDSDEILENNEAAAATEELAIIMDNNTAEPDTSAIEEADHDSIIEDDIIPTQTIRRRPVKYLALSELSDQAGKREDCQNQNVDSNAGTDNHEMVPTPDPQPKKKIKINKKKKSQQEKQGPEGKKKIRTFNFNFLQSPCAKRKHQGSPDQNENSDTLVPEKGTAGTQNEIGKKRRIFGDKVLKTSKEVESGAIQRKIHKHPASLERVNHNLNIVVEHGNSLPTQREEAAADQQRSRAKQKKKNSSVSSGSDDKRSLTVVGKEMILRDSTIAKDVTIAAPQNETVNKLLLKNKRVVIVDQALKEHGEADELCQLKSGIINKKIHNRPVSVQRVKLVDSSSAIEKQSLNPVAENETESSTQTKRPAGKDTKGMLGAQPQKRNCSEFKGKDVNQQMIVARQQKKNDESDIRSRASKKRGPIERPPIVGRESPLALNGIHLLSIVATENEELRGMSESDTEDIHALSDKVPPPSKYALGYDGCVQVTVPTDYLLIDEEGDPFKLGPEDLPLRSHRL